MDTHCCRLYDQEKFQIRYLLLLDFLAIIGDSNELSVLVLRLNLNQESVFTFVLCYPQNMYALIVITRVE